MKQSVKYNEIEKRIIGLIADALSIDASRVQYDSKFDIDLGADSLDMVELIMLFEEQFDCEIEDIVAERIKTVKGVFDYVEANKLG